MLGSRPEWIQRVGVLLAILLPAVYAWAGGSGLNTVVVVNQSSPNSQQLGNYYCEQRNVPPENVLRIDWTGGNITWTSNDFQTKLVQPLLDMLASRGLTNQIDFVVLSMDIPFRTMAGSSGNGTTSALFYGMKPDNGWDWKGVTNSYSYRSEANFRLKRPASAPGYSFLTTMITGDALDVAKLAIDQGVASDGTFPDQPVFLAKSSDPIRNVRYPTFDNAILNARIRGRCTLVRTNSDLPFAPGAVGFQTGLASFSIGRKVFGPGAIADSMSSYAGVIFGGSGQTSLLEFIAAGAAGSYGTVTEPYVDPQKFPNPQVYFMQSRGFSLAEAYYQSLAVPYMGLVVAEPLAAPFQKPGIGAWGARVPNSRLSGVQTLDVNFTAADSEHPIQQVDLFVDGKFFATLTNIVPQAGNRLGIVLNGYPVNYTVPPNATLERIATDFVSLINTPAVSNATKIIAFPRGDRIEIQSVSSNRLAEPFYVSVGLLPNPSYTFYRAVYAADGGAPRMAAGGSERDGSFRVHFDVPASKLSVLQASSNLRDWVPICTNATGGSLDYYDPVASQYPQRFYRVVVQATDPRPRLTLNAAGGERAIHAESQSLVPYAIQFSTDLVSWKGLRTNYNGGSMDLVHDGASILPRCFYRGIVLPDAGAGLQMTVLTNSSDGTSLLRIDPASMPYILQGSRDMSRWEPIATNLLLGRLTTSVTADKGSAATLSTYLTASRDGMMDSEAFGFRPLSISGSVQVGSWLRLTVTKTNGTELVVAVTNQVSGATLSSLVQSLLNLVNSHPRLQTVDGVAAEDLSVNPFGTVSFNVRARCGGYNAGLFTTVALAGSGILTANPAGKNALSSNLSDLRPRNHLYVTAGAQSLSVHFNLDTGSLPDGVHELTAVAYEGTHVATQTRASVPIIITNNPLVAQLNLPGVANTAPVAGTYEVQVSATGSNIARIRLYTTGGLFDTASNQPNATFHVAGSFLGVGRHPFYAEVETAAGLKYRTATTWLRLVP